MDGLSLDSHALKMNFFFNKSNFGKIWFTVTKKTHLKIYLFKRRKEVISSENGFL